MEEIKNNNSIMEVCIMTIYSELVIGQDRFEMLLTPHGGLVQNKDTGEGHVLTVEEMLYVMKIKGNG